MHVTTKKHQPIPSPNTTHTQPKHHPYPDQTPTHTQPEHQPIPSPNTTHTQPKHHPYPVQTPPIHTPTTLQIFCPDGQLSHFIDGRSSSGSWMSFLNCARTPQEQNLAAYQKEGAIFYEIIKEVKQGQELLVWYDDKSYFQFLGIPVAQKVKHGKTNQVTANSIGLEEEAGMKPMISENEGGQFWNAIFRKKKNKKQ